jgi:peptidyl-prolyl cis-trans isomerase D
VVLPDEARARAFVSRVSGGQSFGEAAGAEGFADEDIRIGQVTEKDFATQTDPAVAKAAFAAAQGAITAPVKGPLGWHVVRVDGIVPANQVPLATARAAIAGKLRIEKMEKVLAERVDAIDDRLEGGETLADVAKAFNLEIQSFGPVTADSQQLDASRQLVPVPGNPLTVRAFAADPADGPSVVEAAEGQFAVLEVTDVIAPAPLPLAEIRDRVAAAWMIDTRTRAAEALARDMATAASKGQDLVALAREKGMPPPQELTVQRLQLSQLAQSGQQIPPPVLMLLNVPAGQARVVAAPGSQAWFVVKVTGTVPGDASQVPQLLDGVRQSMVRDAPNELAETFARAVQRSVGVVRQQAAIEAVKRRLTGAGPADPEAQ